MPKSVRTHRFRAGLTTVLLLAATTLAACTGGSSASLGAGGSGASQGVAGSAIRWSRPPWGSSLPLNPYAPGYVGDAFDLVRLPLAYVLPAPDKFGTYYPELATSWEISGNDVTIHLRKSARWQDGSPFTSKDVLTSLLLSGVEMNQLWAVLAGVSTPDAGTVVLHISKSNSPALALDAAMQVAILPASQYGSLIPAGLQQDLVTYWKVYQPVHATNATVAAAAATPAYKAISGAGAELVKFSPKKLIGNGPFQLYKMTSSEVLLKKWDGFWDAEKVTAPWAEMLAMDNGTAVPAFLTGRVDFTDSVPFTDPIYERVDRDSSLKSWQVDTNVQQIGLFFNFKHYPLNIRGVRQALAHVIDRKKLAQVDVGGSRIQRPPVQYPAGIHETLAKQFLTDDQRSSLDPYSLDTEKAADILQNSGFTKRDGTWYTPEGKKFSLTITVQAGNGEFEADGTAIAQMLGKFGIPTTSTPLQTTALNQAITAGNFAAVVWFVDNGTLNPLTYFNNTLVTYNFPASWNGQGKCLANGNPCQTTIGIGPFGDVPGLGQVNLAQTINHQLITTPPGPKWNELTWSWAQYINRELPILPLQNNTIHASYSTKRYTNWPAPSSKLWSLYGSREILYFMQHGYVKLKDE
ncbi:MAG TPA: ABC transporter substrate-binding protein [Mycobacteriales bacterium]|nr:ABC transporter substrate-binding protein [Mycobacteriales bacterium]